MFVRNRQRRNTVQASPSKTSLPLSVNESGSTSQAPTTSELSTSQPQQLHTDRPRQQQSDMSSFRPTDGKVAALRETHGHKELRKTRSWYSSWPRPPKATASTSVARENILGGTVKTNKAPDLSRFETKKGSDTDSLGSTTGTPSISPKLPGDQGKEPELEIQQIPKKERKLDNSAATAMQSTPKGKGAKGGKGGGEVKGVEQQPQAAPTEDTNKPGAEPEIQLVQTKEPEQTIAAQPMTYAGWLGSWIKIPFTETQTMSTPEPLKPEAVEEPSKSRPHTPQQQTPPKDSTPPKQVQSPPTATSSWFGFWYGAPTTPAAKSEAKENTSPKATTSEVLTYPTRPETPKTPTSKSATTPISPRNEPAPKAGSTWAFWSKESSTPNGKATEHEGRIAVIGEGSEAQPTPMDETCMTPPPSKDGKNPFDSLPAKKQSAWRKGPRARASSMNIDSQSLPPSRSSTPSIPSTPTRDTVQTDDPAKVDSSNKSLADSENLLLPSFSSTYQMKENASILKQVASFIMRTQQAPTNHVYRIKDPSKIRKAIAIGVHGLFPATYLRPMIGQPTGTSLRFASLCADAIRKWADAHGCGDCEIEKVALEGEGKINERVNNLWKLMLNWIDHIRKADLVLIACHSQGVPVSIMLLEKLIDLGIISGAKVGVCAMAGVSLGPFPDYKSNIFMGSAAELWEFSNPESENSKRLEASLKRVLDYGARITFIGSIDDQVVPMESAVFSPANHPFIYRAVFIDGRIHAPDFIAHLVGFALKLRNLGVSDHGLIRELSTALAGSLYSGEGHSRLYYDAAVYDLAVTHTLETTVAGNGNAKMECTVNRQTGVATPNPYVLPWIMRGLLEEDFVKTELSSETEELLRQFDDWKPANKALKDVKYRLEAVRSKL